MSERVIETVKFGSVFDLRNKLCELCDGKLNDTQAIGVEQHDGRDLRAFQIVERTLTDGSKTLDIRFVPWVTPLEQIIDTAQRYPGGPEAYAKAINELAPGSFAAGTAKYVALLPEIMEAMRKPIRVCDADQKPTPQTNTGE